MAKSKIDVYTNLAAIQVTESAAATQTSAKFAFPFSIMDKMGLIISRIEYIFANVAALNGTGDFVTAAITTAATVTGMTIQNDPMMVDSVRLERQDLGAAASGLYLQSPFMKDFSSLPGGGLLVAPNPLYGMIQSSGGASAMNVWIRLYYTYIEMSTDEYWQLVESRRVISS